jgi:ABC-2 type transport system ATP-binding protein
MKQRVAIARTLMHDPEVLILDEPANGLDPEARIELRQLLLRLAEQGKTLLVTSHVLPELARAVHRVAIITRGRLRALGTLDEITRQLSPRRPLEVLLTRADQLDVAVEVIRRHVEAGAEITPSAAEGAVRFRTARREEELAALLAALVGAGVAVAQFREVQSDLEEAFMTVARSDRDGAEEDE